jgi:hypothetical protein
LKSFHFWIFNDFFYFYISGLFENFKTWMHLLRWGSTFLWSLVKIGISATIFKMAANKIVKLSKVWFQWKLISRSILKWGIGWCPEFWYGALTICRFCWWPFWKRWHRKNYPECNFHHYQSIPHFATIFKMTANKIVKLSMVWFQWKLISRSILKWGIGWCPEFLYGGRLGTSVFASKHNQT